MHHPPFDANFRISALIFGLALIWTAAAAAQDHAWDIRKPPWDQAKQMLCTEVRRDVCWLGKSCDPSDGNAKITFDFESNRIDFNPNAFGIPKIRIAGRSIYVLSAADPTMALLMSDGRLLKLQYRLLDTNAYNTMKLTINSEGQLVGNDSAMVDPKARLEGLIVGYESWDTIKKEDEIEVIRMECVKKEPGLLDFLKP